MSSVAYWRPKVIPPVGGAVDYQLHRILGPRYWNHDGTLTSPPIQLDESDIPYLQGLRDGGIKGADELIEAIHKHTTIEIWIER